jgi:hypothetical protein
MQFTARLRAALASVALLAAQGIDHPQPVLGKDLVGVPIRTIIWVQPGKARGSDLEDFAWQSQEPARTLETDGTAPH